MLMTTPSLDTLNLTPQMVIDAYRAAYRSVYRRDAHILYVGYSWYRVNGELVHRVSLFLEISRLQELALKHQDTTRTKGLVARMIDRLRRL